MAKGPPFFRKTPQAGDPLCLRGLALGLARIEHALRNMTVHNGSVDWHGWEPKIIMDGTDSPEEMFGPSECDVTVDGNVFNIAAGELLIGQRRFTLAEPLTATAASEIAVGSARWIYVQVETETAAASGGITADALKALDSFTPTEQIIRINLSKWHKTDSGWKFVCRALPELHQHGTLAG